MLKMLNFLGKGLVFIFATVILYVTTSIIISSIPVNHEHSAAQHNYTIYIEKSGIHTDIVVPARSRIFDWTTIANPTHSLSSLENPEFIAIGWGDLNFYQYTPTWNDLTPGTAFKALFLKSPAALHIKFKKFILEDEDTVAIALSEKEYLKLTDYIKNSFDFDPMGRAQKIPNLHYTQHDAFYKAKGSLHVFNTCNSWANNALKSSGLKASLWTPFVEGIFYKYR